MAIRNVRTESDEVLRVRCKFVTEVTDSTRKLIRDMFETMYANNGVGLAAPQIGVVKRIVVIDDMDEENPHRFALVNPVITEMEGQQISNEGCLSLPGFRGTVKRPLKVKVTALDENGNPVSFEAEGFLATICCHEIDHLDGILYKDKAQTYEMIPPAERTDNRLASRR